MFSNIGGKIKAVAKISCWIGIIGSVLFGFISIFTGMNSYDGLSYVITGLLVMIIGSLISWIGSFTLYGFGELVENSCIQTELALRNAGEKSADGEAL